MQSNWWSFGGALFVVVGSSSCSNRPGELIREQEAEEAPARPRIPDSLDRQADAQTLKTALKERLSRSGKGLPIERTAVGTSRIDLRGRFRSVHVATIDENGKKHIDCVTTNGELDEVLKKGGRR